MNSDFGDMLGQFGSVMAICPNAECQELFRLSDARPFLKGRQPTSDLDKIEAEEERIENAIARLEERETTLRERARAAGLANAKLRLRKMDPVFSGTKLDPHDVKIIFDPVEYVVFDGMNSDRLRRILLLAHEPTSKQGERALKSLSSSIKAGNVDFKTLRILDDGGLELK